MLRRFTEWVCALAEIQFRLAIEFIKPSITIDDTDENFFLDLVLAYKLDNQLTESLRVYRIATDITPNVETSWIEFIVFLLEVNQLRTAEHVIQEAFLNIITPRLEILNVGIHYTLNRKKTALKLFKKFTEQTKDIMPSLLFEYFPALANEEDILDLIRK